MKKVFAPWKIVLLALSAAAAVVIAFIFVFFTMWVYTPRLTEGTFADEFMSREGFDRAEITLTEISAEQYENCHGINAVICRRTRKYYALRIVVGGENSVEVTTVCYNDVPETHGYTFLTDSDGDGYFEGYLQVRVRGFVKVSGVSIDYYPHGA